MCFYSLKVFTALFLVDVNHLVRSSPKMLPISLDAHGYCEVTSLCSSQHVGIKRVTVLLHKAVLIYLSNSSCIKSIFCLKMCPAPAALNVGIFLGPCVLADVTCCEG